jgi:diguanylate cyclase (GGDEF)-like protein/PAS domain S-box-containing protein
MTDSNSNVYQTLVMALEDKALLFQAALDQSYNSVVITDASITGDGPLIVYANPSFEKMTGYSVNELIGKSPKMLQGPLTDRSVIDEMRICMRSGKYFEGSTINYNKDGRPYNVEWSISPIKDQSGVIQYFISVQKNITAFIKAQQERNLLAKALNDSPDCVMITDIENKIVFVNSGFEQLTGYEQDEVLGREPSFLWNTKSDALPEKPELAPSNEITHFKLQQPNLRKDSSLFYVDQSIANIMDDAGKITLYVSFSKDCTDRLKRELALSDLASRDALTGLLNRRSGEQLLKQYDNEKQPSKKLLCLIMMDIDNFKKINDTFGHAVGDHILKSSSQLLKKKARNTDSVIRWGGEEFLIIVPDSRLKDALEFAERIRKSIEQHTDKEVGIITASFGVAELRPDEGTASMLNRADKALYKAKLDGKNCVKSAN